VALIVFVVVVLGLSVLIGYAGPGKAFDWTLASVFGTVLGTTLLALTTGELAYLTWSEVGATQQLAETTRDEQQARDRPVVVVGALRWEGNRREGDVLHGVLHVELVNVGLGPAVGVALSGDYPDERVHLEPRHGPLLGPGERFPFAKATTVDPTVGNEGSWVKAKAFTITGTCLDRSQVNRYPVVQVEAPSNRDES
jgi:hypothetical protein